MAYLEHTEWCWELDLQVWLALGDAISQQEVSPTVTLPLFAKEILPWNFAMYCYFYSLKILNGDEH